jgi:RimJ/RimL family protein N-acetyltransferase
MPALRNPFPTHMHLRPWREAAECTTGSDGYLIFARDAAASEPDRPAQWECVVWRPRLFRWQPPGPYGLRFVIWWIFHWLRLFANRDYRVIVLRKQGQVVHRSCVFPGYFRFPFMSADDLQVGDTWTAPACRGQGLATSGLLRAVELSSRVGRVLWYVTDRSNPASVRVVEKAGFALHGQGVRTTPFGLRLLGSFRIARQSGC